MSFSGSQPLKNVDSSRHFIFSAATSVYASLYPQFVKTETELNAFQERLAKRVEDLRKRISEQVKKEEQLEYNLQCAHFQKTLDNVQQLSLCLGQLETAFDGLLPLTDPSTLKEIRFSNIGSYLMKVGKIGKGKTSIIILKSAVDALYDKMNSGLKRTASLMNHFQRIAKGEMIGDSTPREEDRFPILSNSSTPSIFTFSSSSSHSSQSLGTMSPSYSLSDQVTLDIRNRIWDMDGLQTSLEETAKLERESDDMSPFRTPQIETTISFLQKRVERQKRGNSILRGLKDEMIVDTFKIDSKPRTPRQIGLRSVSAPVFSQESNTDLRTPRDKINSIQTKPFILSLSTPQNSISTVVLKESLQDNRDNLESLFDSSPKPTHIRVRRRVRSGIEPISFSAEEIAKQQDRSCGMSFEWLSNLFGFGNAEKLTIDVARTSSQIPSLIEDSDIEDENVTNIDIGSKKKRLC